MRPWPFFRLVTDMNVRFVVFFIHALFVQPELILCKSASSFSSFFFLVFDVPLRVLSPAPSLEPPFVRWETIVFMETRWSIAFQIGTVR